MLGSHFGNTYTLCYAILYKVLEHLQTSVSSTEGPGTDVPQRQRDDRTIKMHLIVYHWWSYRLYL